MWEFARLCVCSVNSPPGYSSSGHSMAFMKQTLTGTIAGTAEAGADSKNGFFAWLHTNPRGPRIDTLQALMMERGSAISSAWAGSLSGGSSLRPSTGKSRAIVTCCSTAAACSIVDAESSDVVEIQLHGCGCGFWQDLEGKGKPEWQGSAASRCCKV